MFTDRDVYLDQLVSRVSTARCIDGGGLGPLGHTGVVARVVSGQFFLIDKGAPDEDDSTYSACYRVGHSRVVALTRDQLADSSTAVVGPAARWRLDNSTTVTPLRRTTLQHLVAACGPNYDTLLDNCWNGVERMMARANRRGSTTDDDADGSSDDSLLDGPMPWQAKLAFGVGAAVGALAGFGALFASRGGHR
ncbi:hypothetical protein BOX15_Mlig025840g1 [Macrostomum lignano]|uniref:LRAT domain-containing protein n=2 Tax=Macrostomum lignano TaxID=282301 RepID=A0A1I8H887_9PLAT|nr:hypothetical protein BOX15_Mlig025840g1 [Macrostomum lignano]